MINKVTLIGRVGKKPELHTTQSGKSIAKFTLATWESFKDDREESGWRQETEWHNIVVWGDSAKSLEKNVDAGDIVYVEGTIHTRSFETREGEKKWITEVVGYARKVSDSKRKSQDGNASKETPRENGGAKESRDDLRQRPSDDLPY